MRRSFVAGNWKMHCTRGEAAELAAAVCERVQAGDEVDVVLFPPLTALQAVRDAVAGSPVTVGAQNVYWEAQGAFTGEISPGMLRDAGCDHVLVGHSERRSLFGETDKTVHWKAIAALAVGLKPVVCVGETLDQREAGDTAEVVRNQVRLAVRDQVANSEHVVIAYEPVWAIGTGRTATVEQAQEVHALIRTTLSEIGGSDLAETMRVVYGGSVKPANAASLCACDDVDGGLIGGASLDADSFAAIVDAAR